MRDVLDDLHRWCRAGRRVATARVVAVTGSAPRDPGAAMAVTGEGEVAGSVAGGCVEAAVVATALEVLERGRPALVRYGAVEDELFDVGLTCGGAIEVFVAPVDGAAVPVLGQLREALGQGVPVALATLVAGEGAGRQLLVGGDRATTGSLGGPELDGAAVERAAAALASGVPSLSPVLAGAAQVFVEPFVAPPRLVVFGAVDHGRALVRVAKLLGYHVTLCDPRPAFATRARFPEADEVVADRPERYLSSLAGLGARDAVCVLTHDRRVDVPAIVGALRAGVGYIGAMGSRRTHADRVRRLGEAGVPPGELARVRSPIGLDLGGRTPEETAISIAAEIIAARHGAGGAPLSDGVGPIHPGPA